HIAAASKGGPRYDSAMTPFMRTSIDNGIWLCANCADMIDRDTKRYTTDLLQSWKRDAEEAARTAQGKTAAPKKEGNSDKVVVIASSASPIAMRFFELFQSHGVHRNQIPRFLGNGFSIFDVQNEATLLPKLNDALLD